MHPHLITLGPLTIKTYGFFVALGFLLGISWASWQAKKQKIAPEIVMDIALISMILGILGARLVYVIINWGYFVDNPLEILMIHHGGLVLYGGVSLAIIGDIIYLLRKKAVVWEMTDIAGPTILLGQGMGRLGCFFNGCCFGQPSDLFCAVKFPPGSGAYFQYPEISIIPLQLFAALINFFIFGFLWWFFSRRHFTGQIFSLYGILYSLYRFGIEFARGDVERGLWGSLSTSQWISIGFLAVFTWLYWHRQKQAN